MSESAPDRSRRSPAARRRCRRRRPAAPRRRLPKNPWVALVLSFVFPGLGQIYNGQPAKALVFFFAFVGAIYGAAADRALPFAFLIPFVYLYNLVDA